MKAKRSEQKMNDNELRERLEAIEKRIRRFLDKLEEDAKGDKNE